MRWSFLLAALATFTSAVVDAQAIPPDPLYHPTKKGQFSPAKVLKIWPEAFATINRGSKHGVKLGLRVVGMPGRVRGVIRKVFKKRSTVRFFATMKRISRVRSVTVMFGLPRDPKVNPKAFAQAVGLKGGGDKVVPNRECLGVTLSGRHLYWIERRAKATRFVLVKHDLRANTVTEAPLWRGAKGKVLSPRQQLDRHLSRINTRIFKEKLRQCAIADPDTKRAGGFLLAHPKRTTDRVGPSRLPWLTKGETVTGIYYQPETRYALVVTSTGRRRALVLAK